MKPRLLFIFSVFVIVVLGVLVIRTLEPDSRHTVAGQDRPVPFVPPIGQENITPAATVTPMAIPDAAQVLTEERAIEIATRIFQLRAATASGSVTAGSVTAILGEARDYENLGYWFDDSYPVWTVSASGLFQPNRYPPGTVPPTFRSISVAVDAITGSILNLHMSDQQEPPA